LRKYSVLLMSAVVAVAGSAAATAAVSNITKAHANMCMPATNDLTRTTNGIRNNTTGSRSVYCGFEVRDIDATGYDTFGVTLRNYGSVARTVTCYWTSGQPYSGGYSSATTVLTLQPDGGLPDSTYGHTLSRPNTSATLGLRCALPPGVAMDLIEVYPIEPA
jgi:hypothetical protein